MNLTGEIIQAFGSMFISPRFDALVPSPPFHREVWDLYASPYPQCCAIAPRGHAKSTALTTVYVLAEVLFRSSDYVILVSSTEEFAAEQLSNIAEELHSNEELVAHFGVERFEMDSKTDIIVRMRDGHRFRILCRGAEQRIRGRLWKGKRPNLLVMDDAEDDEQVESPDRRKKFRHWFFRAAKQALSKYGRTRVHGTILHEDSFLAGLHKNSTWKSLYYKAHTGFDDFTNILWPEQWSEQKLRMERDNLIQAGDSAGYSQEYLNDPMDDSESYLAREEFLPMSPDDLACRKAICASADFAITKEEYSNHTALLVGGKDSANLLHILECRKGRWDLYEIVEQLFKIQADFSPEVFWVEKGQIWAALWPVVRREMQIRDITINFEPVTSVKDKAVRGRSLQRRMRAGLVRFNKLTKWYAPFEEELLRFTPFTAARADDQFDAASLLSIGFDSFKQVEEDDLLTVDEEAWFAQSSFTRLAGPDSSAGRNLVTGY